MDGAKIFGALALALAFLGLVLRASDLERRTFCHPENFAPGLDVPEWASSPPPRPDLEAVLRTTPADGHPPAYFVALLPWEALFGTGLTALRLPSALFGAASIWLLYRLALREGGRGVALFAAALLALHGHHVYWSQMARMYAMAAFLALASTLMLLRFLERGRRADELGYVALTALALWTHVFAWPLVFAQLVWSALRAVRMRERVHALPAWLAAVILGAPVVAHALYTSRFFDGHLEPVGEYFGFAYPFFSGAPFWDGRPPAPIARGWLIAACGLTVALGFFQREGPELDARARGLRSRISTGQLAVLALPVTAFMAWFAGVDPAAPKARLYAAAAIPLALAFGAPVLQRALDAFAARPFVGVAALARTAWRPSVWLALLPAALMASISLARPAFTARGTVIFTPFLLLAAAHGVGFLLSHRPVRFLVGLPAGAGLLALFGFSAAWFHGAQSNPRDYRGLAEEMTAQMRSTDAVFVEDDWRTQPLYYHLEIERERFAFDLYGRWLDLVGRRRRVWVVFWDAEPPPDMLAALRTHAPAERVSARGAHAWLFEPTAGTASTGTLAPGPR